MDANVLTAFGLTLFAGLSTGIGSAIAFTAQRTNYRFLSVSTGFSGGVMLYVAFVEIFQKGADVLSGVYGETGGRWLNAGSFFAGILLIGLIDNLISPADNPHEIRREDETAPLHPGHANPSPSAAPLVPVPRAVAHGKLLRMGLFTAFAITIHNFPEGLATFVASLHDPQLGLAIAIAVALHNIPEGISVSVPIFYATGNRRRAFALSFLSGLAEPAGAAIGWAALSLFATGGSGGIAPQVTGVLFGVVAGIMVYISLDELLPASRTYGKGHDSLLGLIGGMAVMALSLLLTR
ncbi:MAG: Zinc transporter ZupT [Thermoanaerobaculia bacterium]|nr:Zinc transporter ZupT [Thermoanaerobaculia bacterium]